MDRTTSEPGESQILREALGYLNYSSGSPDARFQRNLNTLYRRLAAEGDRPAWRRVGQRLQEELGRLRGTSEAFAEVEQAEKVLGLVFDHLLPAYRAFHRDLLFHQPDEVLFGPFFLARAFEAVLRQGGPWDEQERIVGDAIRELNDYIGHRPVAVLERRKAEPYEHEWVRPVPLYIRGAGVASSRYERLIEQALEILRASEPVLLDEACFDLERLDELALDPRAYDFDHPANKRPNYHFGQWDPHLIDNQGRYRRFVLQQVTHDALPERVEAAEPQQQEEMLFEAAAVLAGTILMASGVSGRGPATYDSSTTLGNLLPRIARYRDLFYEHLLARLSGPHAERLRAEAAALRQPLAGARQHLNQRLARLRAKQLQHMHLAQLFARMGNPAASARQAHAIPVASTRMRCEIEGLLIAGRRLMEEGELAAAVGKLPEVESLLHRAIECGALVDPWNILGFGGQFSLFPAIENSVRDHRVDVLVRLVQRIFDLGARLQAEAAALGETELERRVATRLAALAGWWDQFGTLEVSGVAHVSGHETCQSAERVARSLSAWHEAGAAAGNIGFWREHGSEFDSPKAYALVVEALLDHHDQVASMALLMQWLSQAQHVPLEDGQHSFAVLATRWMRQLKRGAARPGGDCEAAWALARRFFDYLEANADEYWHVPQFEFAARKAPVEEEAAGWGAEEPDEEDVYQAAYEDVVFRDSTADGFEGQTLEGGPPETDFELDLEQGRLTRRLAFLSTVAELWRLAAAFPHCRLAAGSGEGNDRGAVLSTWRGQAADHQRRLAELLAALHAYPIAPPRGTQESLIEYDRRRSVKESLLEKAIAASVAMAETERGIRALLPEDGSRTAGAAWELTSIAVSRALHSGDRATAGTLFPALVQALRQQPLLYVPVARHGDPHRIVAARNLHKAIRELLTGLPRLGLLREACELIETAQRMERSHTVGPGAVTEFDRLFETGFKAIVESLLAAEAGRRAAVPRGAAVDVADEGLAAARQGPLPSRPGPPEEGELIECLQLVTESLLKRWLTHSRSLRLSVLEKLGDEGEWRSLRQFVETYGRDLFTQTFLNASNLRGILHEGVDNYLRSLEEEPDSEHFRLLDELGRAIPRDQAVRHLERILEAVLDNYAEYLDYNTTTTQSDRGEMLYTLLDFLRLKASYERVAWNLRPAILAHEVLVRRGRSRVAEVWRRTLQERTRRPAEEHLERYHDLSRRYGMRLATIADRLEERFVQPLAVDRLRALVPLAVEELRRGENSPSFNLLEQEIEVFAQTPTGVGIDVPAWVTALEQEVERLESAPPEGDQENLPPLVPLSLNEIYRQLLSWEQK